MLRGSPGFYSYGIFERPEGWPDVHIGQARMAFKLQKKQYDILKSYKLYTVNAEIWRKKFNLLASKS